MKIVFDATPIANGNKSGIGYFTYELVRGLANTADADCRLVGHYYNFLGRRPKRSLPEHNNISYRVSRIIPGRAVNMLQLLHIPFPFEILAKSKINVAVFTNYGSLPLVMGGKSVSIIYDLGFVDCPEYVSSRNRKYLEKSVPVSVKRADLVITNTKFTKQRIVNTYGVPGSNILVVPIPPIPRATPDKKTLARYKINSDYFLFVGTIEPRKNISGMLESYAALPQKIKDKYAFVLAGGKGWNDEVLLDTIETLQAKGNKIILTGYTTDSEKAALYESAFACVQASHYEGFGMPLLEAMSYKKPVICSDITVFREVAEDAALYFDLHDPSSLTETLALVVRDSKIRSDVANKAASRLANYPTWKDVCEQVYNAIKC